MIKFDSVLLGDNPFFGVDHLSQERARQKAAISQNFDNALDVIKYSYDSGIKGMVVSTHPELKQLIERMRTKSDLIKKIEFYPILPYAQGYVSKINEKGLMNTLMETLNQGGFRNTVKIITKGGLGVMRKDLFKLFRVFIDIELLQLTNTKIKTVFLHNVITDLAFSLNMKNIFETFQEHLHDSYKLNSGLVTLNLPSSIYKLDEWGLHFSDIMAPFNKVGFQMNPSRQECENCLTAFKGNIIAMSVLAGGYLEPSVAYKYISTQPKIKKLVIGVSSIDHAKKTFGLFLNQNTNNN